MTADALSPVPQPGQPAPDFTLASTSGESVTLSAPRGRPVLLAFFPLAFTSTCTAELCDIRDDYDAFTSSGVVVLPISVDSVATLREFKQKLQLEVDLVSDFKREASRRYGTLIDDRFYSNRAYFLVDAGGTVRWAHVEANPGQRRKNSEIFSEIEKLK